MRNVTVTSRISGEYIVTRMRKMKGMCRMLAVAAVAVIFAIGGIAFAEGELIYTVAGGWIGDGGPAISAAFATAEGVAVD